MRAQRRGRGQQGAILLFGRRKREAARGGARGLPISRMSSATGRPAVRARRSTFSVHRCS
jgi:hypothetical protein